MNLKLKDISYHGDGNTILYISIEAIYGWENKMYGDIIKINYNTQKKSMHLTVKIKNPGISQVVDRIIQLLSNINTSDDSLENPPLTIIEKMGEVLAMEYDLQTVTELLTT